MRLGGRHIAIVGGGIGGLATAIALERLGAQVHVFERTRSAQRGVALIVWSNAMRALAELGAADAIAAKATPIERTLVRRSDGEHLTELPIGDWSRRAEMPTVVVRRGDLIAALAARVRPEAVHEGVELRSFAVEGDQVRARFADGSDAMFDALIGADGIGSVVRTQLHGDAPPRELDQQAWVGWVETSAGVVEHGTATATIGCGPRFWHAPLGNGAFWYATVRGATAADKRALLDQLAGWHAPIAALVEATRDEDIVSTTIRDRPPLEHWGRRMVTLLGDAAHPSTPDLGQGACQAIESAVVLARSLQGADSLEHGLRAYEAARMPRTATISRLSWMTSINSTLETPLLCSVRDAAIRFGLRSVAGRQLEWILAGPPC